MRKWWDYCVPGLASNESEQTRRRSVHSGPNPTRARPRSPPPPRVKSPAPTPFIVRLPASTVSRLGTESPVVKSPVDDVGDLGFGHLALSW